MSPWMYLVFVSLGLAAVTFVAIMSHIPRIPEQRGLLVVILVSGVAAAWSLLLTLVSDPAREIEVGKGLFDLYVVLLVLTVGAALLDLFYYVQARQRRYEGATWLLAVALGLLACGGLGLLTHFNVIG